MHPRNRYRDRKPDFGELAEHRPSLKPYLIQKKARAAGPSHYPYTLDFSNSDALRELACAVLSSDFGLEVVLPGDRLVPMVPQRLNYIHWLEDLLAEEREGEGEGDKRREQVYGIDIGTGASCIYPLLGTKLNGWRFLATEIDDVSVQSAQSNVSRNSLQDNITVMKVSTAVILIGAVQEHRNYDFAMCNPPFYEDKRERYEGNRRTSHRPPPHTFSTGTDGETVTVGGELGFVRRILQDSLILRTQIRWYSSMLGKKASVKAICQELKQHQVPVVVTTEFVQGKTHRWAVAWSFDTTLADKAKGSSTSLGKRAGKGSSQVLTLTVESMGGAAEAVRRVTAQLQACLRELEIEFSEVSGGDGGDGGGGGIRLQCEAHRNTWSQQRKRRRLMQKLEASQQAMPGVTMSALRKYVGNETIGGGVEEIKEDCTPVQPREGPDCTPVQPREGPDSASKTERSSAEASGKSSLLGISESSGNKSKEEEEVQAAQSSSEAAGVYDSGPSACGLVSRDARGECEPLGPAMGSASPENAQQDLWMQIEALKTPCYVQFGCRAQPSGLSLDKESVFPPEKKVKLEEPPLAAEAPEKSSAVSLTFEWIRGNNKDLLHQIVQYLKNTMHIK